MPGPGRDLQIRLYRDSLSTPWGFRLHGGKDLKAPLTIQKVRSFLQGHTQPYVSGTPLAARAVLRWRGWSSGSWPRDVHGSIFLDPTRPTPKAVLLFSIDYFKCLDFNMHTEQ